MSLTEPYQDNIIRNVPRKSEKEEDESAYSFVNMSSNVFSEGIQEIHFEKNEIENNYFDNHKRFSKRETFIKDQIERK